VKNRNTPWSQARRELDSFFPEADHYGACQRLLLEGNPLEEIQLLSEQERFDLIMAPASDRIGFSRIFKRSFRGGLLRRANVPLWTIGPALDRARFRHPLRTVGCLIDFETSDASYLHRVQSFAARFNLRVRPIHLISPVDESTLARVCSSEIPLNPNVAANRIRSFFPNESLISGVEVVVGDSNRKLPKLLKEGGVDLLFVGEGQSLRSVLLASRLQSYLYRLPCPVICIDGAASRFEAWSFEQPKQRPEPKLLQSDRYIDSQDMVPA
jgi:nucleotide-binding universal stress UspA family protein